jgi:DNA-binding CsgD family transcriptional regulator
MAALDPTRFKHFNTLFPAFTPTQSKYAYLYAKGLSRAEISELAQVSRQVISQHLQLAAKKIGVTSLATFRTAIQIELDLLILEKISLATGGCHE